VLISTIMQLSPDLEHPLRVLLHFLELLATRIGTSTVTTPVFFIALYMGVIARNSPETVDYGNKPMVTHCSNLRRSLHRLFNDDFAARIRVQEKLR
jgi:hypothetical protein